MGKVPTAPPYDDRCWVIVTSAPDLVLTQTESQEGCVCGARLSNAECCSAERSGALLLLLDEIGSTVIKPFSCDLDNVTARPTQTLRMYTIQLSVDDNYLGD